MDHFLTKAASMEESMNRTTFTRGEFEPMVLEEIRSWLQKQTGVSGKSASSGSLSPA
jgi:hypothetical protein